MSNRPDFLVTARKAVEQYYPTATVAFVCGSIVRGEATATSDIDLVILYAEPDFNDIHRRSIILDDWPIDFFVHSISAQDHFFNLDCERGVPSMPDMIAHSIMIPNNSPLGHSRQIVAKGLLQKGPPELSRDVIEDARYFISDKLDDLAGAGDRAVQNMILSRLYEKLLDFHLRAGGHWSGTGKGLLRALRAHDPVFAKECEDAFSSAWRTGYTAPVITVADKILHPHGGRNWPGYYRKANLS